MDHRVIVAGNIEIAPVELAQSATGYRWLIPPVDLGNLVALNLCKIIHGQPAREWKRQVESQRADFTTLIVKVVDKPRILAIFFCENFFQLENRKYLKDCRRGV